MRIFRKEVVSLFGLVGAAALLCTWASADLPMRGRKAAHGPNDVPDSLGDPPGHLKILDNAAGQSGQGHQVFRFDTFWIDVIDYYHTLFSLGLSDGQKNDLGEFFRFKRNTG